MVEKQKRSIKAINICIIVVIIIAIIFTAIMLILKYEEKGETNMPFQISKISIISTADGKDVESSEYKWNINVIQNNDIFIYVEKNENNKKEQTIKSIKLENIKVTKEPKIGEIKFYKPNIEDISIFQNSEENIVNELEFLGTKSTNRKNLEISNQGGILEFRCSNLNIGSYISNEEEEINYKELIKKMNLNEEDIKAKISFDIIIKLDSGIVFKAENIELNIPNENFIEEGTKGVENGVDLNEIVFKRIEN